MAQSRSSPIRGITAGFGCWGDIGATPRPSPHRAARISRKVTPSARRPQGLSMNPI